jgi:hypothetical protein
MTRKNCRVNLLGWWVEQRWQSAAVVPPGKAMTRILCTGLLCACLLGGCVLPTMHFQHPTTGAIGECSGGLGRHAMEAQQLCAQTWLASGYVRIP